MSESSLNGVAHLASKYLGTSITYYVYIDMIDRRINRLDTSLHVLVEWFNLI